MAITAPLQARAEALHFDYELLFYTAAEGDVTLTGVTEDASYSVDGSWTNITAKVDKPVRFSNPWQQSSAIIDWTATVSGVLYDSASIATGRLLLCLRKFDFGGEAVLTESGEVVRTEAGEDVLTDHLVDWHVWFCGYITDVTIKDDHQQGGEWTASVKSPSWKLRNTSHPPSHTFGRANAATGGTASASSTLTSVVAEAGKGEFSGIPSVAASNAIDGNIDTLWISNAAPSMTEETPATHGGAEICINEVYREPAGYDSGYRWIELYKQADSPSGDATSLKSYGITSQSSGFLDFHDLGDSYTMDLGDHLILCADERKFRELYDAGSVPVIEWRKIGAWGATGIDGGSWTYNPDGDWLQFGIAGSASTTSAVRWGNAEMPDDAWINDAVPAIQAGKSIRREPAGQQANNDDGQLADWNPGGVGDYIEHYPSPGRHHTATKDDWEWIAVDLGEYSWTFGAEVNADDTTITVSPDTVGLTDSGQIMTDDNGDTIDYTGKTETTLTGVTGILEAGSPDHASGVGFGQYENGIKTKAPKISSIKWKRLGEPVDSSATPAVPGYFLVAVSTHSSPNYPPTENWGQDWTIYANKASGDMYQGYEREILLPKDQGDGTRPRARHVLLIIKQMADSGRAKVNELQAYLDTYTTGESDIYLDEADIPTIVKHLLTTHAGWAAADVITTSCENVFVGDLTTQKTDYVSILADLAKRTGNVLRFSRGMDIHFEADPTFPISGNVDTEYTLDRQSLRSVNARKDYPDQIGQVQLKARNPSEERVYEVSYPQTANDGAVRRMSTEYLVGDEANARLFAEHEYKRLYAALGVDCETSALTDEWCRPPKRVTLNWDLDASDTDFVSTAQGSLFLVTGIDVTATVGTDKDWSEKIRMVKFIP